MPWQFRALPGGIIPEGPGDRIGGDVIAGRTPNPSDLAAAGNSAGWVIQLGQIIREFGIWALIAIVGLIGLWGLLSPGGGVAIIERARR